MGDPHSADRAGLNNARRPGHRHPAASRVHPLRAWLDELGGEFDRRNARLRRTRNALMHGGPIAISTVNQVSAFSMSLAYLATGRAVNHMLNDRDPVDGFLDNKAELARYFARLREGIPVSEAFFRPKLEGAASECGQADLVVALAFAQV